MTITLPAVPVTGTTIDSTWGVAVRTALNDLDAQSSGSVIKVGEDTTERTTASTSMTDLSTISSLNIPAATPIQIVFNYRRDAGGSAAANFNLGLKLNTQDAGIDLPIATLGSQQAGNGTAIVTFQERATNYLRGGIVTWAFIGASGSVFSGDAPAWGSTANMPTAAITSVVVRGKASGSANIYVKNVRVYTL